MKLFIQPDDGIEPILHALRSAKKSIQILIFRIDRSEIERALVEAAHRGVAVQALIAYTNRGGDKNLRRFEMRLLEKGITVTRTSDDLVRYHGKMFIIDHETLYLMAFNFTQMDIALSRSFAIAVTKTSLVEEAMRLFDCDVKRAHYDARVDDLVVSPSNSREVLMKFIKDAKKQLLLYEMKVSDREFVDLLMHKVTEGVEVRIITRSQSRNAQAAALSCRTLPRRLHVRAIMRDGQSAFLGSQSLRKLELEARREIGIIVHDHKVSKQMIEVFEKDWRHSEPAPAPAHDAVMDAFDVPAKKVAKEVARHMSMRPMVEQLLEHVVDSKGEAKFEPDALAQTVREAFREEIQDAVAHAMHDLIKR